MRETFLPEVSALVGDVCEIVIEDNPEVVMLKYPVSFPSDYLRREVCLEVGPLASWHPHADYEVKPYAADVLPDAFEQAGCTVRAITAPMRSAAADGGTSTLSLVAPISAGCAHR